MLAQQPPIRDSTGPREQILPISKYKRKHIVSGKKKKSHQLIDIMNEIITSEMKKLRDMFLNILIV
jgi:hypothetical protein